MNHKKYKVKTQRQMESAFAVFICLVAGALLLGTYFFFSTIIK
jgi:hypothetical protein